MKEVLKLQMPNDVTIDEINDEIRAARKERQRYTDATDSV